MTLSRNIYFFLLLSFLLHAGLGQWLDGDNSPQLPGSTITISLLPPDSRNKSSLSSIQSTGGKPVSRSTGQFIHKNMEPDLSVKPDQLNPSARKDLAQQTEITALASNSKSDPGTSQENRIQALKTGNKLKRMLQNNMAQFFHYPRFALKRGWQGEVTIGIRIEPDGYISRTQLVNSSGYGTLDLAALEGARKLKSLPNAVALLNGQAFNLQLPVIYRLQDG